MVLKDFRSQPTLHNGSDNVECLYIALDSVLSTESGGGESNCLQQSSPQQTTCV